MAAVALTAVQAAALWSWLRWDVRPPGESAAALLLEARRVETDLRAGRLLDWLEARPGGGTSLQPPLVPALLSVGLSLGRSLGTDPADAAVWVVGLLSIVFLSMGAYRFATGYTPCGRHSNTATISAMLENSATLGARKPV